MLEPGWRRWNATIAPIKHNAMECPKVDLKRRWLPTTGDCPATAAAAAIGEQPKPKSKPRMRTRRAHVTVNWPFKCQVQFWATLALPIKGPVAPSAPHKMRFIVAFSCRRPPAVHKFLAETALQLLQLQLRPLWWQSLVGRVIIQPTKKTKTIASKRLSGSLWIIWPAQKQA